MQKPHVCLDRKICLKWSKRFGPKLTNAVHIIKFFIPYFYLFFKGYFICDWWFNFDCAETEGLYSLNDDVAAEREAASQSAAESAPQASYAAADEPLSDYAEPAREARRQGRRQGQRQGRRNQG